jgi:hypothetical protein
MPYTVQFVGLVCFYRERGARLALLPDGRNPENDIDPHYGSIVVAPSSVLSSEGWNGAANHGTFALDPCEIFIGGTDTAGPLDVGEHDGRLPQLRQLDPNFDIDPATAQTIGRIRVCQGKLTVRHVPGGTALISQLIVPHDEPIDITVKPDDGTPAKKIMLAPGTEIAIANMARGGLYRQRPNANAHNGHGDHFRIYEKLSARPVSLHDPLNVPEAPASESHHVLFSKRGPISLYTNCSNTGCC